MTLETLAPQEVRSESYDAETVFCEHLDNAVTERRRAVVNIKIFKRYIEHYHFLMESNMPVAAWRVRSQIRVILDRLDGMAGAW